MLLIRTEFQRPCSNALLPFQVAWNSVYRLGFCVHPLVMAAVWTSGLTGRLERKIGRRRRPTFDEETI